MKDMTTTQGKGGESKEEVNEKVRCFGGVEGTWQSIGEDWKAQDKMRRHAFGKGIERKKRGAISDLVR